MTRKRNSMALRRWARKFRPMVLQMALAERTRASRRRWARERPEKPRTWTLLWQRTP